MGRAATGPRTDLTGQKYSRLLVLGWIHKNSKVYWQCLCDCGKSTEVYGSKLINGSTKSCGCFSRDTAKKILTTHGQRKTRTYRIWWRMVTRVTNPADADFKRYSVLGMAESWKKFENFLADMGHVPEGLSIERVDNDRGYFPENCKWATVKEQNLNRSNTIRITLNDVTKPLMTWCEELGVSYELAYSRFKLGWPAEDLFIPKGAKRK